MNNNISLLSSSNKHILIVYIRDIVEGDIYLTYEVNMEAP